MSDPLASALQPSDSDDTWTPRTGVVTSTSPLQVSLGGATALDANRLTSYTPTVSDVVLIAATKSLLIILGQLG
jgi:hypothetical protein